MAISCLGHSGGAVTNTSSPKSSAESSSDELRSPRKKSSEEFAFFLGILTIIALLVVAPNFMRSVFSGRADIRLLVKDVQQRVAQFKSIFSAVPAPLERLRKAVVQQESNGNHQLLNASGSGAMGLGQIMPENLPSWSQEALGRSISQEEFLSNPELQLKIIDFKLNQYWQAAIVQANGNEQEAVQRVAAWWYSGNPDKFQDTTPQYWDGDAYPSIADYSQQVLQHYLSLH